MVWRHWTRCNVRRATRTKSTHKMRWMQAWHACSPGWTSTRGRATGSTRALCVMAARVCALLNDGVLAALDGVLEALDEHVWSAAAALAAAEGE